EGRAGRAILPKALLREAQVVLHLGIRGVARPRRVQQRARFRETRKADGESSRGLEQGQAVREPLAAFCVRVPRDQPLAVELLVRARLEQVALAAPLQARHLPPGVWA